MPFQTRYPQQISQHCHGDNKVTWNQSNIDKGRTPGDGGATAWNHHDGPWVTTCSLIASNYNFNIPINAKITGVQVDIGYHNSSPAYKYNWQSLNIRTSKFEHEHHRIRYFSNINATLTEGGKGQLLGLPPNPQYYNQELRVTYNAIVQQGYTVYVDYMRATVYYELPAYTLSANIDAETTVGAYIDYNLTLKNMNNIHQDHPIPLTISIPEDLEYVSQNGNGTYNPKTGKWDADLVNSTAKLNLTLKPKNAGLKTVKAGIDNYEINITNIINILAPKLELTSDLPELAGEEQDITYKINAEIDLDTPIHLKLKIPIPEGCLYNTSTGDGIYNPNSNIWSVKFTNRTASIIFMITAVDPGEYELEIEIPGTENKKLTKKIKIIPVEHKDCFYTYYKVPQELLKYFVEDVNYTISCYAQVKDSRREKVHNGLKNFKIAVIQDEDETLGTRVSQLNTIERIHATFVYKNPENMYFRIYGQYIDLHPESVSIQFFGFAIQSGFKTQYLEVKPLFDEPSCLTQDLDYTSITIPANDEAAETILGHINLSGREKDPNILVKGFKIQFDYYTAYEAEINLTLHTKNQSGYKSIVLDTKESTAILGGYMDQWGLKEPISLEKLFFKIQIPNKTDTEQTLFFKNFQFTLYWQYDATHGNPGFKLDGEHSKYYNIVLTKDWDKPEGLMQNIDILELKKSYGSLVTGLSSKSKKIKLKFLVLGEELEDLEENLRNAVQWMSNDLNELRIPIPKKLVFDWNTQLEYDVILNDSVKNRYDIGKIECEAEFLAPLGMANGPTRNTGASDTNQGLTPAYPTITIKTGKKPQIEVFEKYSGQKIKINHEFKSGEIIILDVPKLKVYNEDGVDYTEHISLDSDWPVLNKGKFDFSQSTGCSILKVQFKETL